AYAAGRREGVVVVAAGAVSSCVVRTGPVLAGPRPGGCKMRPGRDGSLGAGPLRGGPARPIFRSPRGAAGRVPHGGPVSARGPPVRGRVRAWRRAVDSSGPGAGTVDRGHRSGRAGGAGDRQLAAAGRPEHAGYLHGTVRVADRRLPA